MDPKDFLHDVLSQPTAPFREKRVIETIARELDARGVPWFADPDGNLVLGVGSRKEYLAAARAKTREPLRLFIAHMDHPGFIGAAWSAPGPGPRRLEVKWHGGSPNRHLDGARVWLADGAGWSAEGRMTAPTLTPAGRSLASAVIEIGGAGPSPSAPAPKRADAVYGGFGFRAPWWSDGELIYTKAADDLVGAWAIASLAIERFAGKRARGAPAFLGLLTRAEEVGFIGAIAHLEKGWLKGARRPVLCVSLETSRQLPGAEIGKGPVLRLGDRAGVFHSQALQAFEERARRAFPEGGFQKRIMDGGTCEATAAQAYGFATVGISVPLGNYHNQSFEGGPDSAGPDGPAPEFVHQGDIEGLSKLCRALMEPGLDWSKPAAAKVRQMRGDLAKYRRLLRSGP